MEDELRPKDPAEQVALFRAQVIGRVLCRGALDHGELAEALRELAAQPVRPPGARSPRKAPLDAPLAPRGRAATRSRRSSAGTTDTAPAGSRRCDLSRAATAATAGR